MRLRLPPGNWKPSLPVLLAVLAGGVLMAAAVVGWHVLTPPAAVPAAPAAPVPAPPPASYTVDDWLHGYVAAARAYKARGRLDRAIALLEEAIRNCPDPQSPSLVQAHYVLAWTYIAKARKPEAAREFRLVQRLAPAGSPERQDAEWVLRRLSR